MTSGIVTNKFKGKLSLIASLIAFSIGSPSVFSQNVIIGDGNELNTNNPYLTPDQLVVIGNGNRYEYDGQLLTGNSNNTTSLDSLINGDGNYIGYGQRNSIFGDGNSIQHVSGLAGGDFVEENSIFGNANNSYGASRSLAFGNRNIIKTGDSGGSIEPDGYVFKSLSNAMVIGNGSQAAATGAITIGSDAYAGLNDPYDIYRFQRTSILWPDVPELLSLPKLNEGENSIAIGNKSIAVNGAIALGEKSVAFETNSISVGDSSSGLYRRITNVDTAKSDYDAVNLKLLNDAIATEKSYTDNKVAASDARTDSLVTASESRTSNLVAASDARTDSVVATSEGRTNSLIAASEARTDSLVSASETRTANLIAGEQAAREAGDEATYKKSTDYTDSKVSQISVTANAHADSKVAESNARTDKLIAAEQSAREAGDAATLVTANTHTDSKVAESNARTDKLMTAEQSAREVGDEATYRKSTDYTDATFSKFTQAVSSNTDSMIEAERVQRNAGDAETLSKSNSYTDSQVRGFEEKVETVKIHTGELLDTERSERKQGQIDTLRAANNHTDSKFRELDGTIRRNERKANAGIAGAIAMTSIPYSYTNSVGFGMAVGTYRGEQSLASGMQFKTSANSNVRVNISWDSQGSLGAGAGFAFGW